GCAAKPGTRLTGTPIPSRPGATSARSPAGADRRAPRHRRARRPTRAPDGPAGPCDARRRTVAMAPGRTALRSGAGGDDDAEPTGILLRDSPARKQRGQGRVGLLIGSIG